jgi:hypothetical protein
MKNKLMFMGVMGAILASATSANAVDLVTKNYVDTGLATKQAAIASTSADAGKVITVNASGDLVVGAATDISGKLDKDGGTMTGDLNMGSKGISGVGAITASEVNATYMTVASTPSSSTDVANKDYVDTELALKQDSLPTTGTTGQVLTRDASGNPVWANTAATDISGKLDLAGGTMTGDLNMASRQIIVGSIDSSDGVTSFNSVIQAEGNVIKGVGTPVQDDDAANKEYVDTEVDGVKIVGGANAGKALVGTLTGYEWVNIVDTY